MQIEIGRKIVRSGDRERFEMARLILGEPDGSMTASGDQGLQIWSKRSKIIVSPQLLAQIE